MDCHRCIHIKYAGCRYGRCDCPGHSGIVLVKSRSGRRSYNNLICPDFVMRRRCSNCVHWKRGEYFADNKTPATKGCCTLGNVISNGGPCPDWKQNKKTSWNKSKRIEEKGENQ